MSKRDYLEVERKYTTSHEVTLEETATLTRYRDKYAVYEIACHTPCHYYVGYSRQIRKRIANHIRGRGAPFTATHKVYAWRIVAWLDNENVAQRVEEQWCKIVRRRNPEGVVCM